MKFKVFYYKHRAPEGNLLHFRTRLLKNAKLLLFSGHIIGGDCVGPLSAQAWPGTHILAAIKQAREESPTCYFKLAMRS